MESNYKNITLENFFFYILMISPIVDTINGAISQNGSKIASLYRTFLIILVGIYILKTKKIEGIYIRTAVLIYLLLLLTILQWIFIHQNLTNLKFDLYSLSRIIFPIAILFITIKNKKLGQKVLKGFSFLFPICILIPYFLRVGTYSYENGAGYKGFFIATNDISIVFLCLLIFSYANLIDSCIGKIKFTKLLYWSSCTFINLISLMIISTKTGIVFAIIFTFAFIVILFLKIKNHKITIFAIGILFLIVELIVNYFSGPIIQAYNRAIYFYTEYQGNLLLFITSSRSQLLTSTIDTIQKSSQKNLIAFLGEGFVYDPSKDQLMRHVIEMDIFDIFTAYGLFGGLALVLYYFQYFLEAFRKKGIKLLRYKLMLIMLIEYSFTAGHVFYTALGGSVLGLVLGQLYEDLEINNGDITSN